MVDHFGVSKILLNIPHFFNHLANIFFPKTVMQIKGKMQVFYAKNVCIHACSRLVPRILYERICSPTHVLPYAYLMFHAYITSRRIYTHKKNTVLNSKKVKILNHAIFNSYDKKQQQQQEQNTHQAQKIYFSFWKQVKISCVKTFCICRFRTS